MHIVNGLVLSGISTSPLSLPPPHFAALQAYHNVQMMEGSQGPSRFCTTTLKMGNYGGHTCIGMVLYLLA